MPEYTWEIQRRRVGVWAHTPGDPYGTDRSDLSPEAFARNVAEEHQPQGEWRIAVWDTPGVGRLPVVALYSTGDLMVPIPGRVRRD